NGVYSATKAAIIALSEAAHAETTGTGVRVSVILPGLVDTDMAAGAYQPPGLSMVTPETVADAIIAVINRPRFEVWVPASTGWLYRLTALLPRPAGEVLTRALRIDRTLVDVDRAARAGYERRVRAGGPTGEPVTSHVGPT
ncbi:MAG: SDR family NAD(P)-dependent oxidoreductase, partial [Actinomycetota bacterium]|nr:SDR family NAD(P)-dependent oxidoreductase [Actinomycetota bacterium]